jgi:signal transduction histidine kinase
MKFLPVHYLSYFSARRNAESIIRTLSHEVRNPQTAIVMCVDRLLVQAQLQPNLFSAEHLDMFDIIRSSSEAVTVLLEGAFDM